MYLLKFSSLQHWFQQCQSRLFGRTCLHMSTGPAPILRSCSSNWSIDFQDLIKTEQQHLNVREVLYNSHCRNKTSALSHTIIIHNHRWAIQPFGVIYNNVAFYLLTNFEICMYASGFKQWSLNTFMDIIIYGWNDYDKRYKIVYYASVVGICLITHMYIRSTQRFILWNIYSF